MFSYSLSKYKPIFHFSSFFASWKFIQKKNNCIVLIMFLTNLLNKKRLQYWWSKGKAVYGICYYNWIVSAVKKILPQKLKDFQICAFAQKDIFNTELIT